MFEILPVIWSNRMFASSGAICFVYLSLSCNIQVWMLALTSYLYNLPVGFSWSTRLCTSRVGRGGHKNLHPSGQWWGSQRCRSCDWGHHCPPQSWESQQSLLLSFGTHVCIGFEISQDPQILTWGVPKTVSWAGSFKTLC